MFTVLFILNPECPLLFKLCENGYDRAAGGWEQTTLSAAVAFSLTPRD